MVKTRQRTRLEAAEREKAAQEQEKNAEEQPANDDDKLSGPSSDDSEGETSEGENVQLAESPSEQKQSDNGGVECLPDILALDNSDEVLIKGVPLSSLRERKLVDASIPSSSLDPGQDLMGELYFSFDVESLMGGCGKGRGLVEQRCGHDPHHELMKKSIITPDFEKRESAPPINNSRYAIQKMKKAEHSKSAGGGWFDMPAPQLTPELKNDLRLLRMRSALDPARHYKKTHSQAAPRYFQIGRVESGPADYYSSRLPWKQRKSTLVDELLASEESRRYHKNKYLQLQAKSSSGTKRLRNIKHKRKYKS